MVRPGPVRSAILCPNAACRWKLGERVSGVVVVRHKGRACGGPLWIACERCAAVWWDPSVPPDRRDLLAAC